MVNRTFLGRIHGRMIEFDEDLNLLEGQLVEVTLRGISSSNPEVASAGLLRTEGALADDETWDGIMDEVRRTRHSEN